MGFISRFRKKATKEGNVAFAKRVTVIAEMEDPSERTSSQASVEQTEKSTPGIASETATTTPPRESRSPENSRSPSTKNAIPKDAGVHAADLAHTPVGYRHRQILLKEPPPAMQETRCVFGLGYPAAPRPFACFAPSLPVPNGRCG